MLHQVALHSQKSFDIDTLASLLGGEGVTVAITPDEVEGAWAFYREGISTTLFVIEQEEEDYVVSMDAMAAYEDYSFFPYLIDTLSTMLLGEPYRSEEGLTAFEAYGEEWAQYSIGEEVAYVKCMLKIGQKYYVELPLGEDFPHVTEASLKRYGVTLHSSSARIYGYVQHMLRGGQAPTDEDRDDVGNIDEYVDVPQHISIGTVKSWQTDGAETTESYSKEDVECLLSRASDYTRGEAVEGVVLNDIGTLYEHGIGVEKSVGEAVLWFLEAIAQGDHLYAPTNLGDIFRKGLAGRPNLKRALDYYLQSDDPYAWYRIGQAYEEGWTGAPDMTKAMQWYEKAAQARHHLALKRLKM